MSGTDAFLSSVLKEEPRQRSPGGPIEPLVSQLFQDAPFGFALLDPQLKILRSNQAFATLNGSAHELAPTVRNALVSPAQNALETGASSTNIEISTLMPDGKVGHFLVTVFPGHTAEGQVGALFIDITERIAAKAELEWNQQRLKNITDVIPMLVTYIDRDYHYRFNNKFYDDWFGTPYQFIRGKHAEEILGKEGFAICKPWMDRALAGETVIWERPLLHPRKGWRQVQIYYAPDIDSSGYINGFVAAVRDIHDERELQRQLELQHKKLRELLSQVPALIWESWDKPDPSLLRTNFMSDHLEKMLNYKVEEWLAGDEFWKTVVHPDDLERVTARLEALQRSGTGGTLEARLISRDGRLVDAISYIEVVCDEKKKPIGLRGVTIDITERKQMESELQRTSEMLKEAIRLRDDFLSIAAHELRTPITVIKLQNQMLSKLVSTPEGLRRIPPEKLNDVLTNSANQIRNLSRLVDELLDVTHIAAGKFNIAHAPSDLAELTASVIDTFRIQAEGIPIRFEPQGPVVGNWDRFRIEQVVANLISNAIKYGEKKPIQVRVSRVRDEAVLEVEDQGIGIDPADHQRIFNRFERAVDHKHISGWGLGLYIARQIVTAHAGTINVRSQLGQGAVFKVVLPLEPPSPPEQHRSSDAR